MLTPSTSMATSPPTAAASVAAPTSSEPRALARAVHRSHIVAPPKNLLDRLGISRLFDQADTLKTMATSHTPIYMILYLTSRCNFRCPMCFYLDEIKDPDKEEMAFPELEKLSKSMGKLVQLSLTGGEPFLRHDIPEIVDIFTQHNKVKYVTIPTNGSLTDRIVSTVEQLVTRYPKTNFRIPLSLDGFPDGHDEIRGAKSFEKIEETLAALAPIRQRVKNLTIDINTCYSSLNQGRLKGIVKFVAERFDIDNHTMTYVRGNAEESTKDAPLEEYNQLVNEIRSQDVTKENRPFSSLLRAVLDYQRDIIRWTLEKDQMYVPCVAGKKLIVVNEKAQVLPCEILDKQLGSLKDHDYNLPDLLNSAKSRDVVRWIHDTKCHCTFECALGTSIMYHAPSYPRLFWRALKLWSRRTPRSHRDAEPITTNPSSVMSLPVLKGV